MSRSRQFCFTLNNYTEDVYASLLAVKCNYICIGKEVAPETGTPHLQGYIAFKDAKTMASLKKINAQAHWTKCDGLPSQNRTYCIKEGVFEERGKLPSDPESKGHREKRRWQDAFDAAKDGRIEDIPADIKCRNLKSIMYAVNMEIGSKRNLSTIEGDMEHEWIVGPTGCGKSRRARLENPGAYIKDPNSAWWDGYTNEEVVIIDDFDKFQVKQGGDMKRWLDRYKFKAQMKGAMMEIRPRKIVVTSQYHPSEIWDDEKTVDAVMRRVKIIEFPVIVGWMRTPCGSIPGMRTPCGISAGSCFDPNCSTHG